MESAERSTTEARDAELHVLFGLAPFVGGIRAGWVVRALETDECEIGARGRGGVPALTLPSLLGLDLPVRAWALLSLPHAGQVALGIGECLATQLVEEVCVLPRTIFERRRGAIVGAFVLRRGLRDFSAGRLGLSIDPNALCAPEDWAKADRELVYRDTGKEASAP